MANTKKVTRIEMMEKVLTVLKKVSALEGGELPAYLEEINFINKQIELLEKQKESRKLSPKQEEKRLETENLKTFLFDNLSGKEPLSVTEIVNLFPEKNFTSQKVTSLLRALMVDELVTKTIVKGTSYYGVV